MMSLLGMEADTSGPARDSIFYKFKIFSDKIRNNRRKVYSRRRKRTSKSMCRTVVGKDGLRRPIPFSDRCPAVGACVSGSVVWGECLPSFVGVPGRRRSGSAVVYVGTAFRSFRSGLCCRGPYRSTVFAVLFIEYSVYICFEEPALPSRTGLRPIFAVLFR